MKKIDELNSGGSAVKYQKDPQKDAPPDGGREDTLWSWRGAVAPLRKRCALCEKCSTPRAQRNRNARNVSLCPHQSVYREQYGAITIFQKTKSSEDSL
jgi:hypothetical protein